VVCGGACALALGAPVARAFELLDGRIQIHGFGEIQTRAIAQGYEEDLDLVQWYNVLSVEIESDILPDGWGPFDLLSSYVRIEGRYDCVWTRGCGTMRSADTYGNRAKKQPRRLADAVDEDFGGQIDANQQSDPPGIPVRNFDRRVSPLGVFRTVQNTTCGAGQPPGRSPEFCFNPNLPITVENKPTRLVVRKRKGFPGFDTLADLEGADAILGPNTLQPFALGPNQVVASPDDDPFTYLFESIQDFRWNFRDKRGPLGGTGRTLILGPWLPKNFVRSLAVLSDRGNPFRGPRTPTGNGLVRLVFGGTVTQQGPRTNEPFSYRWTQLDDQTRAGFPASMAPPCNPADPTCMGPDLPYPFDPVDPRIARDTDGDGRFDAGQALIFLRNNPNTGMPPPSPPNPPGSNYSDPYPNNRFVISVAQPDRGRPFGGDYTGIIPCATPDTSIIAPLSEAQRQIRSGTTFGCWGNIYVDGQPTPLQADGQPARGRNIRNEGGRGELPLRPAPDLSNLTAFQTAAAQGIFYPSPGLQQALAEAGGSFDRNFFNFTQSERAWNRGQSQSYTKEFKEGYLDMEFLDSRLWIRLGKQNIVWGKTELFRTTDQFNPQDLALASLPSLEESRTALFAIRGVYSFYDIGPLEDVRLELAANFDHFVPADLGACGEPFTPDVVCSLTTGLEFHGLTGVGIAGVERPDDPWDDVKGIEFGGRIEFRWDRFSVAIADFYGYNDFPHPDPIHFYERNVDTVSGRPLVAEGLRGPVNQGRCRNGVPAFVRATQLIYPGGNPNAPPQAVGMVLESGDPNSTPPGFRPYWDALSPMMGGLGLGTDPDCLKPGGRAGGPNANLLDVAGAVDLNGDGIPDPNWNAPFDGSRPSPQNALEYHSANQQIFSFVCLGTVTIAASLDGSSCAWTIFGSPNTLGGTAPVLGIAGSEAFSSIFAGEPSVASVSQATSALLNIIQTQQGKAPAELPVPIRPANSDLRDGVLTSTAAVFINTPGGQPYTPNGLFVPGQPTQGNLLSLDSVFTAEQRALLGCGPFYGTRCDAARDDTRRTPSVGFPEGGGVDFLNAEASALLQSWPGVVGTVDGWTTTAPLMPTADPMDRRSQPQPGTIGFPNDSYCTRYVPGSALANDFGLIRLPGCRGIQQVLTDVSSSVFDPTSPDFNPTAEIVFLFEKGYAPEVDGCVLGVSDPLNNPASRGVAIDSHPVIARRVLPGKSFDPNDVAGTTENITGILNLTCGAVAGTAFGGSLTRVGQPFYLGASLSREFAQTAWHPLAGCKTWAEAHAASDAVRRCDFTTRDFESEFLQGTAQIFRNEMAVFSWNFLMFLVVASCDAARGGDDLSQPDCFDPSDSAWDPNRCSLASPQYCRNVKGFFAVAGLGRDDVRAGGSKRFGRLDFIWHSGGELVLEYARRNVFGFSADFAEDVTKTNWGLEFTWFSDLPFVNNDNFLNVSDSQTLNLTISVDRPTFINFLNANRTFFINTQWFFQYLTDYQGGGFTSNGPLNVLFTVAVFTGYYQDRLNPQWVFVYDFGSRSGGLLPTLNYRFTENFSLTIGFNYFFGRGQLKSMPVRGFAPASLRAGDNRYRDGVENVLSVIRHRDEVFFRLRYTF
jgi:hypothetical protein